MWTPFPSANRQNLFRPFQRNDPGWLCRRLWRMFINPINFIGRPVGLLWYHTRLCVAPQLVLLWSCVGQSGVAANLISCKMRLRVLTLFEFGNATHFRFLDEPVVLVVFALGRGIVGCFLGEWYLLARKGIKTIFYIHQISIIATGDAVSHSGTITR